MINIKMQQPQVQTLSPRIFAIGVGGAGGNAIGNMDPNDINLLICNTDAQALQNSSVVSKVQLGEHVTGGLGAGSKPEIGRAAAEESLEDVMAHLEGAHMAFITAGMGGGTGTGAAPVIARACRERGILTVGVVTKPFHFEGSHRMKIAEAGIKEMQEYVDTLIVIPNQNLFRVANEKTTFANAFGMADGVLRAGVRGVTDLMVRPGMVNLDFADIRTAMMEMGKAMMGTGEAMGDKRAIEAAEAAINNPLLDDVSMKGARGVIINVSGGYDMTLFEVDEACNRIRDEVDPDANIIFGTTLDETLDGVMRVSIVATGIDKEADVRRRLGGGGGLKTDIRPAARGTSGEVMPAAVNTAQSALTPTPPMMRPPISPPNSNIPMQTAARAFSLPPGIAPVVSSAPATSVAPAEAEIEMFEQGEFVQPNTVAAPLENAIPANTALQNMPGNMRGERFRDSFIPPRPIEPRNEEAIQAAARDMAAPVSALPSAGMRPPVQKRRSPSLFERITGSVQQKLEGFYEGESEGNDSASAATGGAASTSPHPAQGMLNIDAPAARPRSREEGDLDIPAFLRRQAN